jgi:hypothetical protein
MPKVLIQPNQFMRTSAYQYNCAFNSGANLIVDRLLSAAPSDLINNPMFSWKDSFVEYYELPDTTSLTDIQNIFARYPNAQDQQIILGAALRHYLMTLVRTDDAVKKALFSVHGKKITAELYDRDQTQNFRYAITQFLMRNGNVDTAFHHSHRVLTSSIVPSLNALLDSYQNFCRMNNANLNDSATVEEFLKTAISPFLQIDTKDNSHAKYIEDKWVRHYSNNYARFLGTPEKYLEFKEAAIVYEKLGISVNIYAKQQDEVILVENRPATNPVAILNTAIKNGNHFETIADTAAEALTHNANFSDTSVLEKDLHTLEIDNRVKQEVQQAAVIVARVNTQDQVDAKLSVLEELIDEIKVQRAPEEVVYHYTRNNAVMFFATSKENQIRLDEELARAIQNNEIDFADLPKAPTR